MPKFKCWLPALLLVSATAYASTGGVVASDNVQARLIGETDAVAPGQSIWVALEFNIRDGWHTYWRNPGDSGQATKLTWTLPAGLTAGDIVWGTPHRFEIPPLVNYGYAKHVLHLVKITASPDLKTDAPLTLAAKATWLVCSDVCIPESADLKLQMPVKTAAAVDPGVASLFAAARAELPSAEPAAISAKIRDGRLVLTLGKEWGATLSQIETLAFYPYDDGGIEYAAPQTLTRRPDAVELAMKIGYQPPQAGTIRGVLLATERSGNGTLAVPIEIAAALAEGGAPMTPGPRFAAAGAPAAAGASAGRGHPAGVDSAGTPALPILVLLAVVGGLILNLMPCVFPVLSIKAIGLVEQAKKHPAAVRTKGFVFAAGVVSSMLCLAGVLLALRAGGEEIGWGFQLQSPLFVTLMIYLLLAVGLNLSGVFEIGGGLAGVGDGLTQGDSYRASFFTGVLTTLVATPCTAPFMAAAVGAALTQSPLVALSIFAALGAGLALPYLLLSLAPWMRRALPKPGAWMDTLKQVFAFPMYASAAWLLWVLAQQTSSLGLGAALAGAILVALAAWAYQKSKWSSTGGRVVALMTSLAAVLLAIVLPVRFADVAAASTNVSTSNTASAGAAWQPYDPARVAEIAARGQPLLVNFTASWCLTCLVNERNAFADASVQEIFRGKGVTLMKGDWTNRDPAITKALAEFGRAGVPLYVVYNSEPGSTGPKVLPQLLTPGIVQGVFADLPNRDSK
jgi:thiol:disulfide interchange protein/DsbC/DsbD-like thiol-disulfide interchange protein